MTCHDKWGIWLVVYTIAVGLVGYGVGVDRTNRLFEREVNSLAGLYEDVVVQLRECK